MLAIAPLALALCTSAQAALVTWDIDSTQSFFRLTVPDQSVTIDTTTATLRLRDNSSTSNWTDNGGRRAFLDGEIATSYNDFSTIEFLAGAHNLFALEQTNLRPNPAAFDPLAVNGDNPDGQFTSTGAALAALGARVRASISFLTVDLGYLALSDVFFDLGSSVIPLGGGTAIAASATTFTLSSAVLNFDGVSSLAGQPVPDTHNAAFTTPLQTNSGTGSVANLGGNMRKLTLNISMPFVIDFEGTALNGTANGVIVATALVPEPGMLTLGSFGLLGLVGFVARRRRPT
jgi:MYXO-CTERM domain-containing protein